MELISTAELAFRRVCGIREVSVAPASSSITIKAGFLVACLARSIFKWLARYATLIGLTCPTLPAGVSLFRSN
jgi:hypothetical protein